MVASALWGLWAACSAPRPVVSDAPPIGRGASVSVVLTGDMGSDTPGRREVLAGMQDHCRRHPCDAVVLLGAGAKWQVGASRAREEASSEHIIREMHLAKRASRLQAA